MPSDPSDPNELENLRRLRDTLVAVRSFQKEQFAFELARDSQIPIPYEARTAWNADMKRRGACLYQDLEDAYLAATGHTWGLMDYLRRRADPDGKQRYRRTQDDPGSEFLSCSYVPTHSACVVIRSSGGLYVAIRSKKHGGQIELPGGKSLPGETPWETAIRETREETGLKVDLGKDLPIYSAEIEGIIAYVFVAKSYRGSKRSSPEGEVFWATREEIENGTYKDHTLVFMPIVERYLKTGSSK